MDIEEQPTPVAFAKPKKQRTGAIIAGCVALSLGIVAGGTGIAWATLDHVAAATQQSTSQSQAQSGGGSTSQYPRFSPASRTTGGVAATKAQTVGVVTVLSTIDYDSSEQAAGTGTILTSSGYILTNNHVIEGSTSIKVTVESTNKTYTATVVGDDVTDDVAVLKLTDASGLTTASYDSSYTAAVGDAVTAIGNAGGTGDLVSATGSVTATDKAITVQGDSTDETENLSNLIETSADVVAGDSGGPLVNASGKVIGMDTAATSGTRETAGYAIPISEALSIAKQIESGKASGNVTIGYPAFLGVELSTQSEEAVVSGVIADTPAASAGLEAGDTITAVDGTAVSSASALSPLITAHATGDSITISWTDATGAAHTANVVLQAGPAA
jgi:S1-C subfamily serine protease